MPFRLACFLSHLHGAMVLTTIVGMRDLFRVVRVATDNPRRPYCHPDRRLWRYSVGSELDRQARLVPDTAAKFGLTAYTGRVRPENGVFHKMFKSDKPDAILCSVFGERLPKWTLHAVEGRAWNVHIVIPGQPLARTCGPQPIEKAIQLGVPSIQMVLHQMSEAYDDGPEIGRSEPFPLPRIGELDAKHMMMIQEGTAPLAAKLVRTHLPGLLGIEPTPTSA